MKTSTQKQNLSYSLLALAVAGTLGTATAQQAVLIARLDNLGKGAGRAALQNVGLMLGL